jgi:1-acyl-sn-glycerol-3-phosphate acyltransferase
MPSQVWKPSRVTFGMRLARLLLRLFGWKAVLVPPPGLKVLVVACPHTSNWDFPVGMLWAWASGVPIKFVAKQSLFGGPLGGVLRAWGGVAVDRSKAGGNFVQAVVNLLNDSPEMVLALAPEGSRSRGEHWKSGFYHMALQAGIPIGLAFFDWKRREVGIGGYLVPSGSITADFEKIRVFYHGRHGRKPENETPIVPKPSEVPTSHS